MNLIVELGFHSLLILCIFIFNVILKQTTLNNGVTKLELTKMVAYIDDTKTVLSTVPKPQYTPSRTGMMLNHTDEQGRLFDSLMRHIISLQNNITTSQSTIIYKSNGESGLGNVIIGMVSSLISGLATDRGFQMIPFMIYDYFYEPLPDFYYKDGTIPSKDIEGYFFYPLLAQGRAIRRNHLNKLTKKKSLVIDCFTDVTPHFLENKLYQSTWEKLNLWKDQEPHIENVVGLLYELVMYPKQPLCNLIVQYADKLLKRRMIGVQVRIGGKRTTYEDKQFLELSDLEHFFNRIDNYMVSNHLKQDDVYVFLSTDDPGITSRFKNKYGNSVFAVKEFTIGHSSPNKNRLQRNRIEQFTKRAIVDLLLLQRADYLLYTNTSSYGYLASRLMQNRNSSVIIDDYVDWSKHEDHCSVFERSSRPFFSEAIGRNSSV